MGRGMPGLVQSQQATQKTSPTTHGPRGHVDTCSGMDLGPRAYLRAGPPPLLPCPQPPLGDHWEPPLPSPREPLHSQIGW